MIDTIVTHREACFCVHKIMLLCVISGGQTGVDQIGLEEARRAGIETGGQAPANYLTENGPAKQTLLAYGLIASGTYPERTRANVCHSDGTVLFGDPSTRGSKCTLNSCKRQDRPFLVNPDATQLATWMCQHKIQVLNVAGNRASKLDPRVAEAARDALREAFATSVTLRWVCADVVPRWEYDEN